MSGKLDLSLVISAVDHATAPLTRLNKKIHETLKPVRDLNRSVGKFSYAAGIPKVTAAIGKLNTSLRGAVREANGLGLQLLAMGGGAAFAFKKLFIDPAAQFETYRAMLKTLEGSNEAAQKSMDWVSDFAKRVPYELTDVMASFVKLRTFGLDPMNGTMQAIVDQTAKMGGSQETMEGIVLAVGQAWTKQKLQGEEALQLIERGVPVWDLLAKRTGLTTAQLQKLSEQGKLGRGAIKMLIEEMGKSSAGAAQDQAKTWTGMVSMLSDYWTGFATKVMGSGAFDWLKEKLQGFLDLLDKMAADGRLDELAKQVGENLVIALKQLWQAGKDLGSLLAGLGTTLRWVHDLFGSWKPIIVAVGLFIAGPFIASLISLTGAIWGVGVALMTTPVGWFLAAVAAIAGIAYLIYDNWEPISQFFVDLWEGIKSIFNVGIDWLKKVFEYSPLGIMLKGVDKLRELISGDMTVNASMGGNGSITSPTLAPGTGTMAGQATVTVQVEDGRTRVKDVQARGGIDVDANSDGLSTAGRVW